jgi:hypothetical protein
MKSALGDPVVTRLDLPEHFSSEPDNTQFYVAKGMAHATSIAKTRFQIPYDIFGPVRNLMVVVLTTSAGQVERQRCLAQLQTMARNGDEQAISVLKSFEEAGGLCLD